MVFLKLEATLSFVTTAPDSAPQVDGCAGVQLDQNMQDISIKK